MSFESVNKIKSLQQGVENLIGENCENLTAAVQTVKDETDFQSSLIYQIKTNLNGKAAGSGSAPAKEEQEKELSVTENGNYEIVPDSGKVMSKATVEVKVPERYDEGYSVGKQEGYDEGYQKGFNDNKPVVEPLEVTENGTYTTPVGVDGYSPVSVNVPIPDGYIIPSGTKEITENGTHDVTEYASVEVSVASGGVAEDNIGLLITGNLERLESNITGTFNQYAFYGNTGLKYVSLPNIQYSKERIFYGCSNLETLLLPGLIGYTYQYLAYNCSNLTTVDVHNTSYVSSYSFSNCAKLTRIELDRVETVATNAFNGCSALSTIIIRAEAVPTLGGTNAFTNTPIAKNTGYIYVPAALIDKYKAATNWSTYATRFRAIEDYPTVISGGDE